MKTFENIKTKKKKTPTTPCHPQKGEEKKGPTRREEQIVVTIASNW